MKHNYFLLLFFFSLSLSAQVTLTGTTAPDLSGYGETNYVGQGEYEIFLSSDNILDKPIIVVDGFDPGDTRSITGLYDLLSYEGTSGPENLADFVRTQGFDVVILNFPIYTRSDDNAVIDGGADFIERNAMLLVDLINVINTSKVGSEKNVIIGPSMGGLISRFALNYMENQSLTHDTRLWISFDAPHHGANVPIGLQHQLNFLAFGLGMDLNIVEIQPLINTFLKSPAARQLLTDHFESHLATGSEVDFDPAILEPVAHPWRSVFMNNLTSLTTSGFPEDMDLRKVSMINGSGLGNPYFAIGNSGTTVTPGFNALSLTIPNVAPLTTFTSTVNLTPASADGPQLVSLVDIEFCFITCSTVAGSTANAQAFSFTDGIDAAPGGLFDLAALTGGLNADPGSIQEQFLNALTIDKFNFIPSVSGMALEITNGEVDWYHDFNLGEGSPPDTSRGVNDVTPFINWYIPDNNEGHVELNQANVTFALTEIIPEALSVNEFDDQSILVGKNPIEDELSIISDKFISNAQLQLIDLTGKVVFSGVRDLQDETLIPLNIQSGIYILNISNQEGLNFKTKLAVK